MSLETLISICSVLDLSIDYLLMDELPETNSTVMSIINEVKAKGDVQYQKYLTIIKALALISEKL